LKHSFSQIEGDLNLKKKNPKLAPILKKKKKKASVTTMKKKNINKKRIRENWMDGKILHLIAL
jgi:hypothetical protein